MDIATQAASYLKRFGYSIQETELADRVTVFFEDDSLLGLLWVDELDTIISDWEHMQDEFVRLNASKLRRSMLKTWNLYMICLCSDLPSPVQLSAAQGIQEDFRGARKIVQAGISSETQLLRALYPLIPIQSLVFIESQNPEARLLSRLTQLRDHAVYALVSNNLDDRVALQEFLRAHDIKAD